MFLKITMIDPLKMEGKCSVPQWAVRRFRLDNKGKRAERRATYKLATFRDVWDVFSITLRMYYKSGIYIYQLTSNCYFSQENAHFSITYQASQPNRHQVMVELRCHHFITTKRNLFRYKTVMFRLGRTGL